MKLWLNCLTSKVFLLREGVKSKGCVYLTNSDRLHFGKDVLLGNNVKIMSRFHNSKVQIGNHVCIRDFVEINAKGGTLTIEDYCFIARGVWIGGMGSLLIGQNTMIGIGTVVVSSDHNYNFISIPYYDLSEIAKPINIGKNVWIGANSVILGGTNIGDGSVVAAGSVAEGEYPENVLLAGVPAVIKKTINRL
ncbi:MAG: acyltransferase [Candidatus Cloacimonetes bacterium]|nr:acyltransferase [Candidatus Cloacimonadota bacterium]